MTVEQFAEQFMQRMRGINGYDVACAFGQLTPGIIWKGCGKRQMAEAWASAKAKIGHYSHSGYSPLGKLKLDEIYKLSLWYRDRREQR